MRFVVADDYKTPRDILRQIITTCGHECVEAVDNGSKAVDACRRYRPDVAILDIAMPVMTGDVAAKLILAEGTATHVVVCSSNTQDSVLLPLIAAGAKTMNKPYKHEMMRKLLATLV